MRVFVRDMTRSKTPYRHELDLVAEIAELLDARRRTAWLRELRVEYKAKRNFIRGLPGDGLRHLGDDARLDPEEFS